MPLEAIRTYDIDILCAQPRQPNNGKSGIDLSSQPQLMVKDLQFP